MNFMNERWKVFFSTGRVREGLRLAGGVLGLTAAGVLTLWALSRSGPGAAPIALPPPVFASALPPVTTVGRFTRGTLLDNVLRAASLPPQKAHAVAQALAGLLDPRSLNDADRYELVHSTAGEFARLSIARKLERFVVEAAPAGLAARKETIPLEARERKAAGAINDSLWQSMMTAGLEPAVILEFADVFAWNVDFLTEPRRGDRYALSWKEERTPEGKLASLTVTAALYEGEATGRHTATLFAGDYFDEDGESLRKTFLHAPLNFRRISSGFTNRRFHPVLRLWRAHHGTDYAAPAGTPVVSVGDGSVVFRGWGGSLGNLVKIRHNGSYTTFYGHLSRFEKGLAAGSRVHQGQVIGRVGSTGLSTGPHLHFQVMRDGSLVNFLKLKFPSVGRVTATRRKAFEEKRDRVLGPLEELITPPLG